MSEDTETKRYNLVLMQKHFDSLQSIAKDENTTMLELITRAIKLWFFIRQANHRGAALLIREHDGKETQIVILD